ncbi:MAG: helix-turn-helix transcriptional regulator [Clostridia bacterium]|nr:helix-turn-helix transcriptional regulator [Clostridia bacterium]
MEKDDIKNYCKRLIELRKENNYTQQYVAEYLKIDRSNYSKYELGKLEISIEMLIKLAKLYSVSTDYILCLTDY